MQRRGDIGGGGWTCAFAGGVTHGVESIGVTAEVLHEAFELRDGQLCLWEMQGGAAGGDGGGVMRLMVLGRGGERNEDGRHPPGAEFGDAHGPGPGDRQIGRGVRVGDGIEVRPYSHTGRLAIEERRRLRLPRGPDQAHTIGEPLRAPRRDGLVQGARALAAPHHQDHKTVRLKIPHSTGRRAPNAGGWRCFDGGAECLDIRPDGGAEVPRGFRKTEVDRARAACERARGHARMAVWFMEHGGDAVRTSPRERDASGVSAGADDRFGAIVARQRRERTPGPHGANRGAPVPPRLLPVERMQVEEHVRELGGWQHVPLDPPLGADEGGGEARIVAHQRPRDGQPGIEVTTGAPAGEPDPPRSRVGH